MKQNKISKLSCGGDAIKVIKWNALQLKNTRRDMSRFFSNNDGFRRVENLII